MRSGNPQTKPEVLSPAGDWAALHAALEAGCDAIYFGVEGLNMRAGARNFKATDIHAIARRCHHRGRKAYLALNTLIFDHSYESVKSLLQKAAENKIDAVIASDLAVIAAAREQNLEVHLSTQMSISNARALLLLHQQFGIRRVVPARECRLEDLIAMKQRLVKQDAQAAEAIEFEVFAHGAMCVSISGRCFLSQFQTGKSANRGACQQPCRREYRIMATDESSMTFELGTDYVMSPQDLCTLPFIEQLIEAGVASFKIEGRGRSPEYVGIVTTAYREVVDYYCSHRNDPDFDNTFEQLKSHHLARIQRVYNRGFSNGFYMGKPLDAWTHGNGSLATTRKAYAGIVTNYYQRAKAAEVQIQGCNVKCGDTIYFIGDTTGAVEQTVESMQIDHRAVDVATKGMLVAIRTDKKVRRRDKLYVVIDANT